MLPLDQVESILLLIFESDPDKELEKMIKNAVFISRHFSSKLLIAYPEKRASNLEKAILKVYKRSKNMPVIQICAIRGSFEEGSIQEVIKSKVDLILSHPHFSKKFLKMLQDKSIPIFLLSQKESGRSLNKAV